MNALLKEEEQAEVIMISRDRIIPQPDQPRQSFDQASLERLADSILQEGQRTAVETTTANDTNEFMLIDGERRWRACGIIQERTGKPFMMRSIVTFVKNRAEMYRCSAVANFHREDMHPLDIARALQRIKSVDGLSNAELGKLWGKDQVTVGNYLKLNNLPEDIKALMSMDRRKEDRLSVTMAVQIAGIPSVAIQEEVAQEIVERQLTLADARHVVSKKMESAGYHIGGRNRKPSDDYKLLSGFLSRTDKAVRRFCRLDYNELYLHREDADIDRRYHLIRIKELRDQLDKLEENIKFSNT